MAFCRLRSTEELAGAGELKHAVVIPNLLDSYDRAFSFVLGETFYSIEGLQRRPGYNPHEFIHSITNPMSYDPAYRLQQEQAMPLLEAASAALDADARLETVQ